jgi:hypothetical protein
MKAIIFYFILLCLPSYIYAQSFHRPNNEELVAFDFKTASRHFFQRDSIQNKITASVDMGVNVGDKRLKKAHRQKVTGIVLMSIGTIFLAGSITTGLISRSKTNTITQDSNNFDNALYKGIAIGSGLAAGAFYGIGIPFTIAGSHKVRKYKNQ